MGKDKQNKRMGKKKIKGNKDTQPSSKLDILEIISDWLSFPPLIRRLSGDEFDKLGLDITDTDPFVMIKTRTELAATLKIDRKTLYNYERSEKVQELKKDKQDKWGRSKTPNIIATLYKNALIEGDAPRAKLWFQVFEGWQEKSTTRIESEDLKKLTEAIQKIAEKK